MNGTEAKELVLKCLPQFPAVGLPSIQPSDIRKITSRAVCRLWAGMGSVYQLTITLFSGTDIIFMCKRVRLPEVCESIGDLRKKHSYEVEVNFYKNGPAQQLLNNGCVLPKPLFVEDQGDEGVTICMTRLTGQQGVMNMEQTKAALKWLAKLHATYWGQNRADSGVRQGLQPQGGFWYLDTRPDEHQQMPSHGSVLTTPTTLLSLSLSLSCMHIRINTYIHTISIMFLMG